MRIAVASPQELVPLDRARLRQVARTVLEGEGITEAEIGLAFVDNPTIQQLNQRYLQHAEPTDVLSFPLSESNSRGLAGELVVSAEMAKGQAESRGHDVQAELALYVIHGLLHLCGYDDETLNGWGWPRSAAEARRLNLRLRPLSRRVWFWSLAAGGSAVSALLALAFVGLRLGTVPAEAFDQYAQLAAYPAWSVVLWLLMSALVAGTVEEAAFRGYMQAPIERRHGIVAAQLLAQTGAEASLFACSWFNQAHRKLAASTLA